MNYFRGGNILLTIVDLMKTLFSMIFLTQLLLPVSCSGYTIQNSQVVESSSVTEKVSRPDMVTEVMEPEIRRLILGEPIKTDLNIVSKNIAINVQEISESSLTTKSIDSKFIGRTSVITSPKIQCANSERLSNLNNIVFYNQTNEEGKSEDENLSQFSFWKPFDITKAAAIATLIALIWAVTSWRFNLYWKRKAIVNSLLAELRHNLSVRVGITACEPTNEDLQMIYNKLLRGNERYRYPDFSKYGSKYIEEELFENYFLNKKTRDSLDKYKLYTLLSVDGLKNALISGDAANFLHKRIFLNLGDVLFSANMQNSVTETHHRSLFNNNPNDIFVNNIYDSYWIWTHYRHWFMLVDLISKVKRCYFVDKDYYDEIISKCRSVEKKVTNESAVTKTIHPEKSLDSSSFDTVGSGMESRETANGDSESFDSGSNFPTISGEQMPENKKDIN